MAKGAAVKSRQELMPEKGMRVRNWKTSMTLVVLMLPAMILLAIFNYGPLFGLLMAFQKFTPFKGVFGSPWVGFDNFVWFLTDAKFWQVFRNTLIISFYDLIFGFTAPIIFAILANEIRNMAFKRVMQTISYLPHFLSWVVVGGLVRSLLSPTSGLVNNVLHSVFGMEPIYFITEQSMFRTILVVTDIWMGVGWGSILYFSVISGIDTQLYEAAMIDGAGRLKQTWHITLPGMASMIILLLLLRIAGLFSVGFDRVFNLYNPTVYEVGDVISTYTYRLGIEEHEYSLTTAITLTQSVLGTTLLVSANFISGKVAGLGLY